MVPVKYNRRKRNQTISVFKGINQGINTAMSRVSSKNSSLFMQFKNMKNVSLDDYPAIRTRNNRLYSGKKNVMYHNNVISNILACDKGIVRLENTGKLYFGDAEQLQFFTDDKQSGIKRTLIEYGNSIVVMPDKAVITPVQTEEGMVFTRKEMERVFYSESGAESTVEGLPSLMKVPMHTSIEPTGYDRAHYPFTFTDRTEQIDDGEHGANKAFFTNLTIGMLLENLNTVPSSLYLVTEFLEGDDYTEYFNDRLVMCTQLYNTYTKIQRSGIGRGFAPDDWVRISEVTGDAGKLNSSYKILECTEDYIVINCELEKSLEYSGPIRVERVVPADMDFVVCCDNRLWGCSSKNNRIYACRLGDPTNWEAYGDGLSTDSYWVDVSSEGEFTGATVSGSAVYFFKENCLHKIIGTKPRNFTMTTYKDLGIQKGSHLSAVWIKDRLFYHSPVGVCVYTPGGEPALLSKDAFGNNKYSCAVGGKHGSKYYVSLKNTASGEYELYVYDTDVSCWVKEDSERFSATATYNNILYFVNDETGYIGCVEDDTSDLLRESLLRYKEVIIDGANFNYDRIGMQISELFGIPVEGITTMCGDLDNDGFVTQNDIVLLKKLIASGSLSELDADADGVVSENDIQNAIQSGKADFIREVMAADVNADGEVNIKDASLLEHWVDEPRLYEEEPLEFLLESGDLYDNLPEKKYIQKIELTCELIANTEMEVLVSKNNGVWDKVKTLRSCRKLSVTIPLHPGRCDHFRIKLRGRGKFILYALTITTEGGSASNAKV